MWRSVCTWRPGRFVPGYGDVEIRQRCPAGPVVGLRGVVPLPRTPTAPGTRCRASWVKRVGAGTGHATGPDVPSGYPGPAPLPRRAEVFTVTGQRTNVEVDPVALQCFASAWQLAGLAAVEYGLMTEA